MFFTWSLGSSFCAAAATEMAVYCWPDGAGFLLKKCKPCATVSQQRVRRSARAARPSSTAGAVVSSSLTHRGLHRAARVVAYSDAEGQRGNS